MSDIIILILLLIFSALYAGSEMVFVVVNKLKVELKAQQNIYTAKIAINYLNNPQEFLIISLVGTNIFHIAFSSAFAITLNKIFFINPFYVMLITAFILLIFSEIVPKIYFRENSEKFVYSFAIFLVISKIIFSPLLAVINLIINRIIKFIKVPDVSDRLTYTREDFYNLIKSKPNVEQESVELSYFVKSLELMDKLVKEIMIPRTEILATSKNTKKEEILNLMIYNDKKEIMLYENNIDNIIGYIIINDLLEESSIIEKIIKPVIYVPETLKCSELLLEFKKKQNYISIVVDEFGGTAGLVTFRNILEEIIEDLKIQSEFEDIVEKKLNENIFLFSGRVELNLINEKYKLDIISKESLTLGGFIIEHTGRVPKVGEIVRVGKYKFKILKSTKTRIELVELKIDS